MIGVATAELGLAPAAASSNNGDNFDVFSSLRDGSEGKDFSSGVDDIAREMNADTGGAASGLDLVAVADGKAKLNVAMTDSRPQEYSASTAPEFCRNLGTAACFGCVSLEICQKRQALAIKQGSSSQEGPSGDTRSTLDELIAPDNIDDVDEYGRGKLVLPSFVSLDDQKSAAEETTTETEDTKLVIKTTNKPERSAEDSDEMDVKPQSIKDNSDTSPEKNVQSQPKSANMLPQQMEVVPTMSIDNDTPAIGKQNEVSRGEVKGRLLVNHGASAIKSTQDRASQQVLPADNWSEKAVIDKPKPSSYKLSQADGEFSKLNYRRHSDMQSVRTGQHTNVSSSRTNKQPTQKMEKKQPRPIDDVINTTHEDSASEGKKSADATGFTNFVVNNEANVQYDLSQKIKAEPAADQADSKSQIMAARDVYRDDVVERAYNESEIWADKEEAAVSTWRQESPAADMKLVSAEQVAIGLATEISDLCEEIKGLYEVTEAEPVVRMDDAVEILTHDMTADCDDEPVDQPPIAPRMPIIEQAVDSESRVIVTTSQEREASRKECEIVLIETSRNEPLPPVREEMLFEEAVSAEPIGDAPEEKIVDAANAEMVEIEAVDSVSIRREELVNEVDVARVYADDRVMNNGSPATDTHSLSGLWSDDSRLNPEEESTSAQSSTDDVSLVSRLVGMFVVAMCVVRGRRAEVALNN